MSYVGIYQRRITKGENGATFVIEKKHKTIALWQDPVASTKGPVGRDFFARSDKKNLADVVAGLDN